MRTVWEPRITLRVFLRVFERCGVVPLVSSLQFCVCVRWAILVSSCSDPRPAIWVACLLLPSRALHLLNFAFKLMCFQHTGSVCSRCTPINPFSGGVSHLQSSFSCSQPRVRVRLGHRVIVRSLCSSLVGEGVVTQTSALMCGLSLGFFVCLVQVLPL